MQDVICSPDVYYSSYYQNFIESECTSQSSKWVYDIINNTFLPKREQIFINEEEWCLCADQHHGNDARYLVIFKNIKLKTIRDLRSEHVKLLLAIHDKVREWLCSRHKNTFHLFFHYMPSVFQLHLHVTSKMQYINRNRAHFLTRVISNIQKNSQHYAEALLLTVYCRTIRRAETHETVQYAI